MFWTHVDAYVMDHAYTVLKRIQIYYNKVLNQVLQNYNAVPALKTEFIFKLHLI